MRVENSNSVHLKVQSKLDEVFPDWSSQLDYMLWMTEDNSDLDVEEVLEVLQQMKEAGVEVTTEDDFIQHWYTFCY